jgi:hypothetical protein
MAVPSRSMIGVRPRARNGAQTSSAESGAPATADRREGCAALRGFTADQSSARRPAVSSDRARAMSARAQPARVRARNSGASNHSSISAVAAKWPLTCSERSRVVMRGLSAQSNDPYPTEPQIASFIARPS